MNDDALLLDAIRRYRFPQHYAEGRRWFLAACAGRATRQRSAALPAHAGPDGEPLATDAAWFGPEDASRVFLSISGTHGTEYASGAAMQLQWLVQGGPEALPADVAVCLLHAHNPYGAAQLSRANENFVDLNRNYFSGAGPERPNPLYPALFELLFTREMDEHVLDDAMDRFDAFMEANDREDALTAMGGGQITHPSGNIYCGLAPEWSTLNLRALVGHWLAAARRVAVLDWHTGLGAFGSATLLCEASGNAAEDGWCRQWWGGTADYDALQPTRPRYVGCVAQGVAAELRARGAQAVSAVVEFGTFENRGVLMSLLIDRWLRFECRDPAGAHALTLKSRMAQWLNPCLPEWREAVLRRGGELYGRTLAGLAAWA